MPKRVLVPIIIVLSAFALGIIFFGRQSTVDLPVIKAAPGEAQSYAVYTAEGDILYANTIKGIKKSIFNEITVETDNFKVNNPVGIVENPPFESIVNIYNKVLEAINNDRKVLIIYIDGLGYEMYKKAKDAGNIPYIASQSMGAKALTVYPSITDVTFAAMVTGNTPKYTGIHSREKKPLLVPTIFDIASQQGKASKLIEGNIRIIIDEVPTILNIDDNKNGTIDDEIYGCAINEIQNPPHILMVHFHSYDDFGHKYGPGSEKALDQLGVLDSYIENIMKDYAGDVIITADHGMHDVGDGGEHGTFSSSDMFIPIIIKNK